MQNKVKSFINFFSEAYIKWVENLPKVESPEWSGLPNNAEKLLREQESHAFLTDINKIQVSYLK